MTELKNPLIFVTAFAWLLALASCSVTKHDADMDRKRLADDLTPAETLAHKQGERDLGCSQLKTVELAAKNAEGAPLGPIWSNFEIQISGCGKVKTYKVQCEIDQICFIAK